MNKAFCAIFITVGALVLMANGASAENPSDTTTSTVVEQVCSGGDSGKIDTPGDPATVTATAPEGKLISGYCVKAGSAKQGLGPEYITLSNPVKSLVFTHTSGKDVSHYSLTYVDDVVVDVCPNIDGAQSEVPSDKVKDDAGNCVTPPTDVCPNLDGNQETVPNGMIVVDGDCVEAPCDKTDPEAECYEPPCDPNDPNGECYEPPCDKTDPKSECYEPPVTEPPVDPPPVDPPTKPTPEPPTPEPPTPEPPVVEPPVVEPPVVEPPVVEPPPVVELPDVDPPVVERPVEPPIVTPSPPVEQPPPTMGPVAIPKAPVTAELAHTGNNSTTTLALVGLGLLMSGMLLTRKGMQT